MNQVVVRAVSAMVFIWSASGCAPMVASDQVAAESEGVRIELPRCALQGRKSANACIVTVFDGTASGAAQREAGDRWSISVAADTATAARIALYSAPGFVPVVQAVRAIPGAPSTVTLNADADSRGGYLVGVVFRKSDVVMDGGACSIESFVAQQNVIINRVRARLVVTTDNLGSFVKKLPAGQYTVQVENVTQTISVPQADSRLVVLALEPNKRNIE